MCTVCAHQGAEPPGQWRQPGAPPVPPRACSCPAAIPALFGTGCPPAWGCRQQEDATQELAAGCAIVRLALSYAKGVVRVRMKEVGAVGAARTTVSECSIKPSQTVSSSCFASCAHAQLLEMRQEQHKREANALI